MELPEHDISIEVKVSFMAEQSVPDAGHYVFAYEILLTNRGHTGARLLSRYWHITDGQDRVQEVRGEGVVGEQPYLAPGSSYRYSSGAILPTPVGRMQGSYRLIDDHGASFELAIPAFTLAVPRTLH